MSTSLRWMSCACGMHLLVDELRELACGCPRASRRRGRCCRGPCPRPAWRCAMYFSARRVLVAQLLHVGPRAAWRAGPRRVMPSSARRPARRRRGRCGRAASGRRRRCTSRRSASRTRRRRARTRRAAGDRPRARSSGRRGRGPATCTWSSFLELILPPSETRSFRRLWATSYRRSMASTTICMAVLSLQPEPGIVVSARPPRCSSRRRAEPLCRERVGVGIEPESRAPAALEL